MSEATPVMSRGIFMSFSNLPEIALKPLDKIILIMYN